MSSRFTVYESEIDLKLSHNGREERRVPGLWYVGADKSDPGRLLLVAADGRPLGWIDKDDHQHEMCEWVTRRTWSPDPDQPQTVYPNAQRGRRGRTTVSMPPELVDKDVVFPVLDFDVENLMLQVGSPLPRTLKTSLKFPTWVAWRQQVTNRLSGTFGALISRREARGLLSNLGQVESMCRAIPEGDWIFENRTEGAVAAYRGLFISIASGDPILSGDHQQLRDTAQFMSDRFVDGRIESSSVNSTYDRRSSQSRILDDITTVRKMLMEARGKQNTYTLYLSGQRRDCVRILW